MWLPENPVRVVRRPLPPKSTDRRFRQGEEDRLRQAMQGARNPFLVPVVDLDIESGMRQGEVVGLLWQHINLKHRVTQLSPTKSGEARSVPLSSKARAVLAALKPADVDAPTGPVFAGLTGEAVKRAFICPCDRAGPVDFYINDLGHEAASRLFEKGLNPMEVASIPGHKTLQMLKRTPTSMRGPWRPNLDSCCGLRHVHHLRLPPPLNLTTTRPARCTRRMSWAQTSQARRRSVQP